MAHTQHRTRLKLCMHPRPEEQDVRAGQAWASGGSWEWPCHPGTWLRGQQVLSDTCVTWPPEDAERPSEGLMVSRTSEGAEGIAFSLYPCGERFSHVLLVKEIKSPVWVSWKEDDCHMAWAGITVEHG